MNIVIQHVPGTRQDIFGRLLLALPHATVIECDGRPMETFGRCLVHDAHWHIEDDALLADDFVERSGAVIRRHGGHVIRGFGTGFHHGWMPGSSYLFNQCTWLPTGAGPAIARFLDTWPRLGQHPTGFDLVIRDWLVANRSRYWLESPSLVQHSPGPSLLGARSRLRISPTFAARYGGGP